MSRTWVPLLLAGLVLIFAGCEGDTGPTGPEGPKGLTGTSGQNGTDGTDGQDGQPGPNMLVAYGFVDDNTLPASILGLGPVGVVCTCTEPGVAGYYRVTLTGTFPAAEGVLLVTPSTGTTGGIIQDTFAVGDISSWSATQIVFDAQVYSPTYGNIREDFAFVVLGL